MADHMVDLQHLLTELKISDQDQRRLWRIIIDIAREEKKIAHFSMTGKL